MTAFIGRREFITLLGGAAVVAARGAGAAAGDAGDRIPQQRIAGAVRQSFVAAFPSAD